VRDDDRSALELRHDLVERRLHDALALIVERRRRLVEQQHCRLLHQRTRNRHALLLPARQLAAAHADIGTKTVSQVACNKVEGVCVSGGVLDFCLAGVALAVANIVGHRAHEQHWLLADQAELIAQPAHVERLDVLAVEHDRASLRVVEALEQLDDRGLTGARRARQRHRLSGGDGEAVAVAHEVIGRRGVGKDDVPHLDVALDALGSRAGLAERVDLWFAVGRFKKELCSLLGSRHVLDA